MAKQMPNAKARLCVAGDTEIACVIAPHFTVNAFVQAVWLVIRISSLSRLINH
jgi:hypothetical protein